MSAEEREAERKYDCPAAFDPPPVPALGAWARPRRLELAAEYYDTADRALTRAGWSLRRRSGGADAGWHLKSPPLLDVRRERRRPDAAELPPDFRAEVEPVTGGRPLERVAVLRTVRHEFDLIGSDGRLRAHLCDDRVAAEASGRATAWREVEVELAPGEPLATLDAVEAALLDAGCARAGHASKVARALEPPGPDAARVGAALGRYAAAQAGAIAGLTAAARSDAPDAVHKLRVACRRLRSALRAFGPVLGADADGTLAEELRWFGDVAGRPRDAEVLREHLLAALQELGPDAAAGPAGRALLAALADEHAAAHAELVRTLDGPRFAALRSRLATMAARPAGPVGPDAARACVAGAIARVERRAARAGRRPDELLRWHEVRKAAKAARYACEALADAYGPDAAATAAGFEAVTEALGELQDTVVASETLRRLRDAAAPAARDAPAAVYDALLARQDARRAAALAQGRTALDAALAERPGWLS